MIGKYWPTVLKIIARILIISASLSVANFRVAAKAVNVSERHVFMVSKSVCCQLSLSQYQSLIEK